MPALVQCGPSDEVKAREEIATQQAVTDLADERLRGRGYLSLRNLTCEIAEGVLVVHGTVPSFYLRQVAQNALEQIPGVRQVVDHIDVARLPRRANRYG